MSKSKQNDSNKGFLSSTNILKRFNIKYPCKSLKLAEKKATNEMSTAEQVACDSLVLTEPYTDLAGTSSG